MRPLKIDTRGTGAPGAAAGDWRRARERACAYLAALDVPRDERDALARQAVGIARRSVVDADTDAIAGTLAALRRILMVGHAGAAAADGDETEAFLAWRLHRWLPAQVDMRASTAGNAGAVRDARVMLRLAPPLTRAPMVPERVERNGAQRLLYHVLERLKRRRAHRAVAAAGLQAGSTS